MTNETDQISDPLIDENDLLSELLGDVKSYELLNKIEYDLLVISSGIEESAEKLVSEIASKLNAPEKRPFVIQIRSLEPLEGAAIAALGTVIQAAKGQGRGVWGYPSFQVAPLGDGLCAVPDLQTFLHGQGYIQRHGLNPEIVESFCVALRMSVQIQFKAALKFSTVSIREPKRVYDGFTSSVELVGGGVTVALMISMPRSTLDQMMTRMLGKLEGVPEDIIMNGVTELVNIVGGQVRAIMNDAGYSVRMAGIPSLVTPEFQNVLSRGDDSNCVMIQVDSELGPMVLEARFFS